MDLGKRLQQEMTWSKHFWKRVSGDSPKQLTPRSIVLLSWKALGI
jgi:hypothetical protein